MLDSKDILTKAVSTLIVGAVVSITTMAYNSISSKLDKINKAIEDHPNLMQDLEDLSNTKEEMQAEYIRFKGKVSKRLEKDSTDIIYIKGWVNYWRGLDNN